MIMESARFITIATAAAWSAVPPPTVRYGVGTVTTAKSANMGIVFPQTHVAAARMDTIVRTVIVFNGVAVLD